ncbi:MAG: twin-arginine translocase subunit TatC [Syntrophorhabdaceae bacterium]|nr:twin-arginine translocase subunit TatC [Syntrophorhabdaceae bacterium]
MRLKRFNSKKHERQAALENRFTTIIAEVDKARKGITICLGVFFALVVIIFPFSERVLAVMVRLLGKKLISYSPSEAFLALASLSVYCAFILTLPVAVCLLWRGAILPRVPQFRKKGLPFFAIAIGLFLSGVLLGYFVILPAGIGFLVGGFENEEVKAFISASRFIGFCGGMLIALGIAFEMPLLSFFLARMGWLKPAFFQKRWRYAVTVCTVLAAIITPTPDVYNMMLMMVPLLGLYAVSFIVVLTVNPK